MWLFKARIPTGFCRALGIARTDRNLAYSALNRGVSTMESVDPRLCRGDRTRGALPIFPKIMQLN